MPHQARDVLLLKEFPPTGKKRAREGLTLLALRGAAVSTHRQNILVAAHEGVLEELCVTPCAFITRSQKMTCGHLLRNQSKLGVKGVGQEIEIQISAVKLLLI